jgi:hypothetical protein
MNEDIMRKAGFGEAIDNIKLGLCPFCNNKIVFSQFRNEISRREFGISGLCQSCQDETFNQD